MRVVHDPEADTDDRTVLATDVSIADGIGAKIRGLRFRSSIPADFALVFPFDGVGHRDIDMLFVRTPIDVLWMVDEEVQRVETLSPWFGFGFTTADTVIELPPGAAEGVSVGDRVFLDDH